MVRKMSYKELLREGLIKPFKAPDKQIRSRMVLADRDIRTARMIMASDWDWGFSIAYNAILQAARALMFSKGYRPTGGEGQHIAAVRFAEIALGKQLGEEVYIFDKMRSKRHRVIYDAAGLISEQEARQAFKFAQKFVKIIKGHLRETGKR